MEITQLNPQIMKNEIMEKLKDIAALVSTQKLLTALLVSKSEELRDLETVDTPRATREPVRASGEASEIWKRVSEKWAADEKRTLTDQDLDDIFKIIDFAASRMHAFYETGTVGYGVQKLISIAKMMSIYGIDRLILDLDHPQTHAFLEAKDGNEWTN